MLAALLTGVPAVGAGLLSPVELAVVVLTPLAAFEATSLLPAAAIQVQRSRAAAARVLALLDAPTDPPATDDAPGRPPLVATDLACGWPGTPPVVTDLALDLRPGRSVAIVGPSGTGKTPHCSRSQDCSPGRPAPSARRARRGAPRPARRRRGGRRRHRGRPRVRDHGAGEPARRTR